MTGEWANSPMPLKVWIFEARVRRVVDGDTLDVDVDQGMHTFRMERLRLWGVNTPEKRGGTLEAGKAAQRYVMDWATLHGRVHTPDGGTEPLEWPFRIQTEKADVFGRYLAYVWCIACGACLNDDLIADKVALVDIRP